MKRLLIRNGRVVDPSQGLDQGMDILVEDGHVAAIGERLEAPARVKIIDAAGLVVAPGFIETDMTEGLGTEIADEVASRAALGRLGRPEEIAAAVGYLASDDAAYVTGQTLVVDGGLAL